MRRQRKQLAVGRDKTAMRKREQDAARGGAWQLRGAGDVAERHRAAGCTERLQQAQAAVETLDEIGGTLLAVLAFQLWHLEPFKKQACPYIQTCHNSPVSSIGEHYPRRSHRHDEPGSERPDHPHWPH